jgi:hypothetical protein
MLVILNVSSQRVANLQKRRLTMTKLNRISELTDQLNELLLPNMAASLDTLYHSKDFDQLDRASFLKQLIELEYQAKTSLKFQYRLKRAHLS